MSSPVGRIQFKVENEFNNSPGTPVKRPLSPTKVEQQSKILKVGDVVESSTHVAVGRQICNTEDNSTINQVASSILSPYCRINDCSQKLRVALCRQDYEEVKRLFAENAGRSMFLGETVLNYAAQFGDATAVSSILSNPADGAPYPINLEAKDADGMTALALAVTNGFFDVATILVQSGSSLKATNNEGKTPLHIAASLGKCEFIPLLVDDEGLVLNMTDASEDTPLKIATRLRCHEFMEKLVGLDQYDEGSVNLPSKDGRTAVHIAAENKDARGVEILWNGWDILEDENGLIPMEISFMKKDIETIRRVWVGVAVGWNDPDEFRKSEFVSLAFMYFPEAITLFDPTADDATIQILKSEYYHRSYLQHQYTLTSDTTSFGRYEPEWSGFNLEKMHSEMMHSIRQFYKSDHLTSMCMGNSAVEVLQKVPAMLEKSLHPSKTPLEQLDKGEAIPLYGSTRAPQHAVAALIFKSGMHYYLMRCDKARRASAGIRIDEIGNPSGITSFVNRFRRMDSIDEFNNPRNLGLVPPEQYNWFIPQKKQKIGNCTVANLNSLERAVIFYLTCIRNTLTKEQALSFSKRVCRARTFHTQLVAFNNYMKFNHTPELRKIHLFDYAFLRSLLNISQTESRKNQMKVRCLNIFKQMIKTGFTKEELEKTFPKVKVEDSFTEVEKDDPLLEDIALHYLEMNEYYNRLCKS